MNKNPNNKNSKNKYFTPPQSEFMIGAEHFKQDEETGVWQPSDEAVADMRNFSKENKL